MDFFCGVIFQTPKKELLLQERDNKPKVLNPGKIGTFGGRKEANESLEECAIREVEEEVGLKIAAQELETLGVYKTNAEGLGETESHIFIVKNIEFNNLALHEGKSIVVIDPKKTFRHLDLTPVCKLALKDYLEEFK